MAEQKLPDKAQENEMKREKVRVVPIKYIDDSPDHPFQVRDDEEMMSLVESIATFGVITPIIARKTADERYELISGHRRKRACELLHIDTLPIIVRDLSREEGIILMVDSNLQREHILPSEKAFAYKMKIINQCNKNDRQSFERSVAQVSCISKSQITRKGIQGCKADRQAIRKTAYRAKSRCYKCGDRRQKYQGF